jgi:hypothetical protein
MVCLGKWRKINESVNVLYEWILKIKLKLGIFFLNNERGGKPKQKF